MSEQQSYGFGKFVPGFDFLQNLSKGSSQNQAALPNLTNWVAPTLNVEELDKRIGELRAVHFWLEQNSKALGATIQALELQKMTLATLKGMNFNMAQVADAFRLQTEPAGPGRTAAKSAKPASVADAAADAVAQIRAGKKGKPDGRAAAGVADPLQWWGALTQQFQTIAARALDEAARGPAIEAAREIAQATGSSAATSAAGSRAAAQRGAVESPAPGAPVQRGAAAKKASAPRRPATKKASRKRAAR